VAATFGEEMTEPPRS